MNLVKGDILHLYYKTLFFTQPDQVKMAKQIIQRLHFFTSNNQTKIVRIGLVTTLENSQKFIASKKMPNQKRGHLKVVAKLHEKHFQFLILNSPSWLGGSLEDSIPHSKNGTLVPASRESKTDFILKELCLSIPTCLGAT